MAKERKKGVILKIILIILLIATVYMSYSEGLPFLRAEKKGYKVSRTYSDSKTRHYYDGLSDKEKKAYRLIETQVRDFPEEIPVMCLDSDELKRVYTAVIYDNPEFFFLGDHCTIKRNIDGCVFVPEYTMNEKDYSEKKALCDKKAKEITDGAPSDGSEYDLCLYVHNKLLEICRYADSGSSLRYTICGCLLDGKANCEGYSKTATYLLSRMGIKSYVITGESSSGKGKPERHMWNIVYIDGKPYVMDVTWDDYTLTGKNKTNDREKVPSHIYFLRSAADLSRTHVPDNKEDWEGCKYSDMNYFKKTGTYFDSYRSLRGKLPYRIAEAAEKGERGIEIQLSSDALYREAEKKLFDDGDIREIVFTANIGLPPSKQLNGSVIKYTLSPETRVIRIYI